MLDDHISLGTTFAGYVLDTKDLIIIAGSIFFVLIVVHGLWVARRNRQNAIHMDIKASETMDESSLDQTSADFPNGGARIISQALQDEGVETRGEERSKDASAPAEDASMAAADGPAQAIAEGEPSPPRTDDLFDTEDALLVSETRASKRRSAKKNIPEAQPKRPAASSASPQNGADKGESVARDARRRNPQLEELLILGVMAKADEPFGGDDLVAALRGQGLKFGDMAIFHRTHDDSGERLFSVANAVEPGTFDLSDLSELKTPGLTFFMQLPVPGDALETLEDMILSARTVAAALGGDVKDDTMSALTGQTVEHLKQRIADFVRKQLTAPSDG